MIMSFFNKISITDSSFMVFLTICFIVSIFCYNNNSFAIQTDNSNNINGFNIITAADFGCSLRAQENIKKIEKMNPELVLVPGDLSYKKTADCWINMTKPLDSKIKIAMGNHEDYEEEGKKGKKLKKSLMDHYGLDKSYYSFDYKNVHILVLDTQLELSVDTLQSSAVINETLPAISPVEGNLTEEAEEHKKKNPLLKRYPI